MSNKQQVAKFIHRIPFSGQPCAGTTALYWTDWQTYFGCFTNRIWDSWSSALMLQLMAVILNRLSCIDCLAVHVHCYNSVQ